MKRLLIIIILMCGMNVVSAQNLPFIDYIPVPQSSSSNNNSSWAFPEPPRTVIIEQNAQWDTLGEIRGESQKDYRNFHLQVKEIGGKLFLRVYCPSIGTHYTLSSNPYRGHNDWRGKYNYKGGDYYFLIE